MPTTITSLPRYRATRPGPFFWRSQYAQILGGVLLIVWAIMLMPIFTAAPIPDDATSAETVQSLPPF